ncbi:LysR family transcriptional regulator [Roseovarius sp. ZX-A-9]|uniref:LysR family transcriptional regulator n=1 Tax=Roseovarius sp. ZX-A-9 TaxID=3014783 RepID=UPI00232CD6AC|nr:LysR family transcriptional regulator [Roseovarius sp. ZX-A-9]MDX1785214.1 LysR family transcriptional regulator [Roseovarius sp.]
MNFRELELFGTLMRVGTTIETARVLGISQPGVSAQIKRLEGRLGFALFRRAGNRLEPTAEASALFEEAMPMFATHLKLLDRAETLRQSAASPLSISATPAVVEGFLAPRLKLAGYDGWRNRIRLNVSNPEEDVRIGRAELGLQMAVPAKSHFQAAVLRQVALIAVVRSDSPLAARATVTLVDLAREKLVCYDPNWSPMGAAIQRAYRGQGLPFELACDVPFCSTVCPLVESCGGVGIVDEFTGARHRNTNLKIIEITDLPPVALVAFHRRNEPMRAVAHDLLSSLVDNTFAT